MKQEDTRQKILDKALELFAAKGYDSVSVGEIAQAVGIKAPSLYNHFPGKQAIFDAIVEATAAQYEADTDRIDIHVQDVGQDIPVFTEITEDALFEKVRQIFSYSLHNETISRFRRMMTIEQFRSPELAALYSRRYVGRVLDYHAGIFRALIAAGEICPEDPDTLAMLYVAPVVTLLGVCDRQPEREAECLELAREIGFPLVMKVVGPVHKSDVGGVVLNVRDEETVVREFRRMMQIKDTYAVMLAQQLRGTEVFIGAKREGGFGHIVMCGLGGIFIEVLKDVNVGLAPVSPDEARAMIRGLKSYKIIQGVRGQEPVNEEKFVEAVVRVSMLVRTAPEIFEMDLNPLLGNRDEVVAVDARIRIEK